MDVTCPCGTVFQARSRKARYCSDRCRKRKDKAEALGQVVPMAPPSSEPTIGGVEGATGASLTAAGALESPLGQACMVLARRLDSPGLDTGSAVAAVAARLDDLLAKATKGAGAKSAPQQLRDELADRRQRHA